MRSRAEHIRFCKQRAQVYLDMGDPSQAVASMMSDLNSHEETKILADNLAPLSLLAGMDINEARRFINGFTEA